MKNKSISIKTNDIDQFKLLGPYDEHIDLIESKFDVKIVVRGEDLIISGENRAVDKVEKLFYEIFDIIKKNKKISSDDIQTVIDVIHIDNNHLEKKLAPKINSIVFQGKKGEIKAKTPGQNNYIKAAEMNDIVFTIGPAGTGKTFLAVAIALAKLYEKEVSKIILSRPAIEKLYDKEVSKIILSRPAIEAGESLGYLPGDMMEKVDPYLKPLTDALFSMLPSDKIQNFVEQKIIEIIPLAYMRGRTLDNAFVILDEAQNCSSLQMKMFLTRLGKYSKAIITGDITQIDLTQEKESGLIQIQRILKGIDGIAFVYLNKEDVIRHRLVKRIINAYENFQRKREQSE
ncbi:MAG: PhoH family protein [bacterium]